ncbi:MAG: acetate/propionate family kinase [Peptococcaceae bacterium]
MKVLVINCGSSSLKYQVFDMEGEKVLAKGVAERIGIDKSFIKHEAAGQSVVIEENLENHQQAIQFVLKTLISSQYGVLTKLDEIDAVGHRVAHGGFYFSDSVLITEEVKNKIRSLFELAPLHNPPNLQGIDAVANLLPEVPQTAVFDTAFHQTMPKYAYLYGLPYAYYEKYKIRKYGFHGTSHKYVAQRAGEILTKPWETLKIISCHLGNGASITAIKDGKSLENTMGFTPLEGLIMGTRSGDIDPSIVSFLMEKEGLNINEINNVLNKKSGVLGISGISSDFRDLEQAGEKGSERAKLAIEMFIHDVKLHIGAYTSVIKGLDVLIFTAGLGENGINIREKICTGMDALGITIDKSKNQMRGRETEISKDGSSVKVYVIPTNEELMIARDTKNLVLTSSHA